VKNTFKEKSIFSQKTLAEQIYHFMGDGIGDSKKKKYFMTFEVYIVLK